ncbi:collagen-like protein [Streptomyces sp. NPDC094149]|uniref:collagen-like protein n=1 Tax=Streptomyces sp. NPDC094149 TaxID=3155079 RepID=UPI00332BDF85
MTRAERVLARRWKLIALLAFLLALTGSVLLVYVRVQAEAARADQLAAEADLRGTAVSTLAGDVRVLRAQIKARGGKPAAPDPTKAVKDLPDRAAVPVPIPGPPGPPGPSGKPAPTLTPSPGASGAPGADSTVPGPQGPKGEPGADSTVPGPQGPQGERGEQGPPPSGWTYTDGQGVTYECTQDGDGSTYYTCRATSTPEPSPAPAPQNRGLLSLAVLTATASYRRL